MSGKRNRGKLISSLAIGGLVGAFGMTSAQAVSVGSQFFNNELNSASDNSAEYLQADNVVTVPGQVDIGDVIEFVFDIQTIEDQTGGGGTNQIGTGGVNELSGIGRFKAIGKTTFGLQIPGALGGTVCLTPVCITFGPDPLFEAFIEGLANTPADVPTGIMVALFEDATPDFDRTGTIATGVATASDGTYVGALGFGGDADEIVVSALVSDNVLALGAAPLNFNTGTSNFNLSILEQFLIPGSFSTVPAGIPTAAGDGLIDMQGSGNILGKGASASGFDFFDDFNLTLAPVFVPEPASIALVGLSLIGFGAIGRRQRKNRRS